MISTKLCKWFVTSLVLGAVMLAPYSADATVSPGREFIMSCTYGVMAGTLVGAASLAFSSSPSNSLQNVARGASLGLYLGIALGYYTAYVLPKQIEKQQENIINSQTSGDQSSSDFHVFPYIAADRAVTPGIGAIWQF